MILQTPITVLHEIADTVGMIISVPLLVGVIQIVRFVGRLENSIAIATVELRNFSAITTQRFERQDSDVEDLQVNVDDLKGKVSVLWDGHERRKPHPEG